MTSKRRKIAGRLGRRPTAAQRLLNKFQSDFPAGSVTRETSNVWNFFMGQVGERCVRFRFANGLAAGQPVPTIGQIDSCFVLNGINQEAAGVTISGPGWSGALGGGYGGTYRRTSTAGDYVEFTTPAGVTRIFAFGYAGATNAGVSKVTIDGDPTLATELPTAQQLVDAGTLANTVLVANGGTLNPSDRIWNQYNGASPYGQALLAGGLAPGAHTVRVTCAGYKQSASTDVRLYCSGFACHFAGVSLNDPNAVTVVEGLIGNEASRWEFAHSVQPEGTTSAEFMGHSNTVGTITSVSLTVDGVDRLAIPASVYTHYSGEVVLTVGHNLTHPEGGGSVGGVEITYTWGAGGLRVEHTITWLRNGVSSMAYPAMLALPASFNRGANIADPLDYTLDYNDGRLVASAKSQAAYLWQGSGNWGALLFLPNLALSHNNFADCDTRFLHIEDRSGGSVNKIYAPRLDHAYNIAVNDVWQSEAVYRIQYFAGGAEGALARP